MARVKYREYCCCAIPLVNAGIYSVLLEQLALGIIVGTLSIATPSIVGAATPSFAKWILAIVCYVAAGIQVLGFIGVAQENSQLYRKYVPLHGIATVAVFAVAAAWIIISATRHSTAKTTCVSSFFSGGSASSPTASEAGTLCDIFPWVDVGIMGGLWGFFAVVQVYFYIVVSSYGSAQRLDHETYDQGFDTKPLADDIPMTTQTNAWDSRPSNDRLLNEAGGYSHQHQRSMSGHSTSTVMGQPIQQEVGGYDNYEQAAYPPRQNSTRTPQNAYTQEPGPTPAYTDNYYSGGGANDGMTRPPASQAHPGES